MLCETTCVTLPSSKAECTTLAIAGECLANLAVESPPANADQRWRWSSDRSLIGKLASCTQVARVAANSNMHVDAIFTCWLIVVFGLAPTVPPSG
eukprot:4894874-Alexandrium_andersonii.AAC.1